MGSSPLISRRKKVDPVAYLRQPTAALGTLVVPVEVRLNERVHAIRYRLSRRDRLPDRREPPPDLFANFCRLADVELRPDRRVADFASEYGVLGPAVAQRLGLRAPTNLRRGAEPLVLWRRAAQKTRALARLFASLAEGDTEAERDWADALLGEAYMRLPPHLSQPDRRVTLTRLLIDWSEVTRPRHELEWSLSGITERIEAKTPLGALHCAVTWQLRLAITSEKGLAVCSDCGNPYVPSRKPNPNRERFCDECGLSGAWRIDKRNERMKRAAIRGYKGDCDG